MNEVTKSIAEKLKNPTATPGAGHITKKDETTVANSIYNKLFSNQIAINELDQKYINENKTIDVAKASARLRQLDTLIETTQEQLFQYTDKIMSEIEESLEKELATCKTELQKVSVHSKHQEMIANIENTNLHQQFSTEIADYKVEHALVSRKIEEYENENKEIIAELLAEQKKQEVAEYLAAKEQ